ncbi:MAG: phosphorylated adapter RNA export RNA-binding domain-containing protein [Chloroflexaceae bacterium]
MPDTPNVTTAIAQALGETTSVARAQIARIVARCGAEQAQAWLAETQQIEANGGMPTLDGTRRRTPGGVYFYLVRGALRAAGRTDDLRAIFPRPGGAQPGGGPATPATPPMAWAERGSLIEAAQTQPGEATTVKMTLIGRPGKTVEREQFTLLMLTHQRALPALPKGIPVPQTVPATTYIVYVGAKQWRKVKDALADPEDLLIVEGVPMYDAQYQAIAVFATNTTTKTLQRAQRG